MAQRPWRASGFLRSAKPLQSLKESPRQLWRQRKARLWLKRDLVDGGGKNSLRLPLGISALDDAMEGGVPLDALTEIRTHCCAMQEQAAASYWHLPPCCSGRTKKANALLCRYFGSPTPSPRWKPGDPMPLALQGFRPEAGTVPACKPRASWRTRCGLRNRVESGVFPATILEVRGNPKHFGLTESRRLNLRAKASGARFSCCAKLERKRQAAPSSASLPNPRRPRRGPCRMARCFPAASATRFSASPWRRAAIRHPSPFFWNGTPMTAGFSLSANQPTLAFQTNAQRILALSFPASSNRPDRQKEMGTFLAFARSS
jgi:protein ImuA